jgi:hypothetical protein
MPKGSRWLGRASAVVQILEPIATRGLGLADVPALRDRARATIAAAVAELRAKTPRGWRR